MAGKVQALQQSLRPDELASWIAYQWNDWNTQRRPWLEEKLELRNYVFATDTTKTSNASLPWKNKTTIPKLCQIRDNLHANYMAALFPNDDWLKWEGYSLEDEVQSKKEAIQGYMANKFRACNGRAIVSQLIYDFIDYGIAIGDVEYVSEYSIDPDTNERVVRYVGPRPIRISPLDICWNPTATSFEEAPKISRFIKGLGELRKEAEDRNEQDVLKAVSRLYDHRKIASGYSVDDLNKVRAFEIDGFGNLYSYYQSGFVEILEFEGDWFDSNTGELHKNRLITIADRSVVLRNVANPSWTGGSTKRAASWRRRPDNTYPMGPLDNLVGMQYRMDHLENLKSDVFDFIAHPVVKCLGDVEEFDFGPGARINGTSDSNVEFLRPDATALNADLQIERLEARMEEYAGAPKQAMGIRTPGEKTAFEVQQLMTAAGRIFQDKVTTFEIELLEPMLNAMLEIATRKLDTVDVIRVMDDDLGVAQFLSITKEDITASGKLRPIGARHFATQAQLVQNLVGLFGSPAGQAVMRHLKSKSLARLIEDTLNLSRYDLFNDNAAIFEEAETQRLAQTLQDQVMAEGMTEAQTPVPEELLNGQIPIS